MPFIFHIVTLLFACVAAYDNGAPNARLPTLCVKTPVPNAALAPPV